MRRLIPRFRGLKYARSSRAKRSLQMAAVEASNEFKKELEEANYSAR